ncbi:hypothetical protein ACIFOE_20545 [Paenibacillus sp. NRS-1783]|uniref:hypothetical protein n=1 Tax=Paenibacillus sp. NRS-1783 TaxID=3233907 RepID=UPI003D2D973A
MESIQRYNGGLSDYNNLRDSDKTSGYIFDKIRNGVMVSSVDLTIGGRYIIEPENQKKLKHRGRKCTLIAFETDKLDNPIRAKVRFDDTNRDGMVELSDLVNILEDN